MDEKLALRVRMKNLINQPGWEDVIKFINGHIKEIHIKMESSNLNLDEWRRLQGEVRFIRHFFKWVKTKAGYEEE